MSFASLKDRVLFITGASRGIGLSIALRAARDGAKIVIAAKTTEVNPKIPGTIFTAAQEIEKAGGQALPLAVDVRDENQIHEAVKQAYSKFGRIDILVNNASAIGLTPTMHTPLKRYDLMNQINTRGTFACSQACYEVLKKSDNPHILMLSPPLNIQSHWFAPHLAYTISKYGMSFCVLGLSEEWKDEGIAVNALWPKTTIATAAVRNLLGGEPLIALSRTPEFVAEAAHWIFRQPSKQCTGNFFIDEEVNQKAGIQDFRSYQVDPSATELQTDLFLG